MPMDLILWRHAEAEDGVSDLERRLTAKGEKHAQKVGAWLDRHLPRDTRILVSPAVRAQQTARALDRACETIPDLAPGASVAAVLAAARWPHAGEAVLVVGHQPWLGMVAAFLLGGEEAPWTIRKSGVWWFSNREKQAGPSVALRCVMGHEFL